VNTPTVDSNNSVRYLHFIIEEAAALGAIMALVHTGGIKPYLKKNEAFRKFGRARVERWIESGYITIRKDGNHSAAWRIDRIEIEAIAIAEKLRAIGL
jgi:hypothetical protein